MANEFRIAKTDSDKMQVFGWANVAIQKDGTQIEDFQGDIIDPEELEKAAYEHVLHFRNAGERHDPALRQKGKLIESCVFTKEKQAAMGIPEGILPQGWWVGFQITDKSAWEKIKSGEYQMFSVEGTGERIPVDGIGKSEDSENWPVAKTFAEILSENDDFTLRMPPESSIIKLEKAMTFSEIVKFNPYHDRLGRFSTAGGAAMFTYKPGASRAHDSAIAGEVASSAVEKAKKAEPKLTKDLQDIATSVGGEIVGLKYAVKSESSLKRKIETEQIEAKKSIGKEISASDVVKKMYDINRYTMSGTEKNLADIVDGTLNQLRSKGYEVIQIKDSFGNENAPYRGINCKIKTPEGLNMELQFHTPKSLEIKEINHKLYEEARKINVSPEKKDELEKQMRENAQSIVTPDGIK